MQPFQGCNVFISFSEGVALGYNVLRFQRGSTLWLVAPKGLNIVAWGIAPRYGPKQKPALKGQYNG